MKKERIAKRTVLGTPEEKTRLLLRVVSAYRKQSKANREALIFSKGYREVSAPDGSGLKGKARNFTQLLEKLVQNHRCYLDPAEEDRSNAIYLAWDDAMDAANFSDKRPRKVFTPERLNFFRPFIEVIPNWDHPEYIRFRPDIEIIVR